MIPALKSLINPSFGFSHRKFLLSIIFPESGLDFKACFAVYKDFIENWTFCLIYSGYGLSFPRLPMTAFVSLMFNLCVY